MKKIGALLISILMMSILCACGREYNPQYFMREEALRIHEEDFPDDEIFGYRTEKIICYEDKIDTDKGLQFEAEIIMFYSETQVSGYLVSIYYRKSSMDIFFIKTTIDRGDIIDLDVAYLGTKEFEN